MRNANKLIIKSDSTMNKVILVMQHCVAVIRKFSVLKLVFAKLLLNKKSKSCKKL